MWDLGHGWTLDLDPRDVAGYAAFLLLPIYRRTSHRKRDLLIVALVPFYGQLVAATIVSRLIALPRRDWTPRVDELPRVVRIPGGRGAYVLPRASRRTGASAHRVVPQPRPRPSVPSWEDAQTLFCQSARG